jgi:hypothetical protein
MGTNIDLYKVDYQKLIFLSKEKYSNIFNDEKNEILLRQIINSFGELVIQKGIEYLIILHNEYYEDCVDPWNMTKLIEKHFNIEDYYSEVFIPLEENMISNVDIDEVKEVLGLEEDTEDSE